MAPSATCADLRPALPMIETLRDCTHAVFATMVGTTLEARTPLGGDALRPRCNVVGTIGFGGSRSGLVVFYATVEAARHITQTLLALETAADPSQAEVADAIGEITNMIAGSFRTRMATDGDLWAISIPTVTMGSDFYITPLTDGRRTLLPFRMQDHELFVELVITTRTSRT
ncbi:MAG: chemotaxis protein CheX [Acidobacteria bacterium]|nr:chemotaxis protein CheX [Acidobacteriota bacterium]